MFFIGSSNFTSLPVSNTNLTLNTYHTTCRWISPGIPISFTNKTNRHNITEILLKVALEHRQTNKQTDTHFAVTVTTYHTIMATTANEIPII
jgi:hypothetical protein